MADAPTLQELLRGALNAWQREIHTALPGKVKSYDAATQTAEVIPVVQGAVPLAAGGFEIETLPVIPNVRVLWPRAGGVSLHLPMAAGDFVLLVFSEAAFGQWRATGQVPSPPGDLTRHGLSYPYALPGGWPDASPIADAPASGEAVLSVGSNVFRVGGASAELVARADKVDAELAALKLMLTTFCTGVSTAAIEPTLAPAAGALNTSLGSWPSAATACSKLKAV